MNLLDGWELQESCYMSLLSLNNKVTIQPTWKWNRQERYPLQLQVSAENKGLMSTVYLDSICLTGFSDCVFYVSETGPSSSHWCPHPGWEAQRHLIKDGWASGWLAGCHQEDPHCKDGETEACNTMPCVNSIVEGNSGSGRNPSSTPTTHLFYSQKRMLKKCLQPGTVAHTYNSSNQGDWGRRSTSLRPSSAT